MKLFRSLRKIRNKFSTNYIPSVEVLISKTNLLHNLHEYQKQGTTLLFAPVLKSNAYGHGLVQVAQILDKEDTAFLVLDSLYEAMILRNEGIKSEILIVGHTQSENIKKTKVSRVAFTISSLEQLKELAGMRSSRKIHLKVDTGMHRQGILPSEIEEAMVIIKSNKFLHLEGVCSHFADADGTDESFTKSQIKKWEEVAAVFRENFSSIKFFHISATAGASFAEEIVGNVVRLGIGLYGINSRPVLKMQSFVSSVKTVPAGDYVGYNITYQAKQNMKIATVPVGYFEGVDRRLSNCGFFKIGENFCPILGRVSMNITSIDVSSVPNVKVGDKVLIISDDSHDKNSVENIAKLAGTISWEILVHIPQHLRRVVVE